MSKDRIQKLFQGNQGGQWMPAPSFTILPGANFFPTLSSGSLTASVSANGTRINSQGLIEPAVANTVRVDFNPVTLEWRGWLIEEARTNLLIQTILPGGGAAPTGWTRPGGTGTSAPVTSIYGNNDGAVAYLQTATAQRPFLEQTSPSLSANTVYVASMYVESVSSGIIAGSVLRGISGPAGATLSYPICEANPSGGEFSVITTGRLCVQVNISATPGTVGIRCGLGCTAVETGTLQFSRPQLEAGSLPTSYIPTSGTSVARTADSLSLALGSWFNATEGTFVVEVIPFTALTNATNQYFLEVSDGTTAERYALLRLQTTGVATLLVQDGGVNQVVLSTVNTLAQNNVNRFAAVYKLNDFASAANGGAVVTDTSGTLPTVTTMSIGYSGSTSALYTNGWLRKIYYYPVRYLNQTLQEFSR